MLPYGAGGVFWHYTGLVRGQCCWVQGHIWCPQILAAIAGSGSSPVLSICDDSASIVYVVRAGISGGIEGTEPGSFADEQGTGGGDIEGIDVWESMIRVPKVASWIVSNVSIPPNSLALEKTNTEPTLCAIAFPTKSKREITLSRTFRWHTTNRYKGRNWKRCQTCLREIEHFTARNVKKQRWGPAAARAFSFHCGPGRYHVSPSRGPTIIKKMLFFSTELHLKPTSVVLIGFETCSTVPLRKSQLD